MMKSRFLVMLFGLMVFLGFSGAEASVVEGPTCIVIPSRYTIVQFSFDVMRLRRQIYLVAHDKEIGSGATVLHIWDDKSQDWIRIGVEEYVAGTIFTAAPKRLIVIGRDVDVPEELSAAPVWASEAFRVETLDLVGIMNRLQPVFRFNAREWKWLAQRYNISFEDLNAERRRYGKYGKPGEAPSVPVAVPQAEERMQSVPQGPIQIITAPEPETVVIEQPKTSTVDVKTDLEKGDTAPENK